LIVPHLLLQLLQLILQESVLILNFGCEPVGFQYLINRNLNGFTKLDIFGFQASELIRKICHGVTMAKIGCEQEDRDYITLGDRRILAYT
jgi:hypothetical protein